MSAEGDETAVLTKCNLMVQNIVNYGTKTTFSNYVKLYKLVSTEYRLSSAVHTLRAVTCQFVQLHSQFVQLHNQFVQLRAGSCSQTVFCGCCAVLETGWKLWNVYMFTTTVHFMYYHNCSCHHELPASHHEDGS